MTQQDNGGAAFPLHPGISTEWKASAGISLRDWLAGQAPVSFEVAMLAYGGEPHLLHDTDRAAFFAAWSFLRYEYADAMLSARSANAD